MFVLEYDGNYSFLPLRQFAPWSPLSIEIFNPNHTGSGTPYAWY
jgi:hypothetical protein